MLNKSGRVWEIAPDNTTLIAASDIHQGFGDSALEQVLEHRPFTDIEDLLLEKR
jgi:hypothetical protein